MATRLHMNVPGMTWTLDVAESFETVMDHIFPIAPPSSTLEGRTNLLYTSTETGKRLAIPPSAVHMVEELADA